MLVAELKKIELRKKEREKKQQDLQKLITAAEQNAERYTCVHVTCTTCIANVRVHVHVYCTCLTNNYRGNVYMRIYRMGHN